MKLEVANQMTMQQLCDYAIEKLVEQGGRCLTSGENDEGYNGAGSFNCAYGMGAKHCGIGWMLDEENDELMKEVGGVTELIKSCPEHLPSAILKNPDLATWFQILHDGPSERGREECLHRLQKKYNLDISNPAYQQWVDMGEKA